MSKRQRRVAASIEVDAPAAVMWDILSDPHTYTETIDWVYEIPECSGVPLEEGSFYVERAKPGPRTGLYRWDVTEAEEGRYAVHSHRGGELEADLRIEVEPLGDERCRLTQVMRFRALPKFRPLGVIVERLVMGPSMRRDFERMILPNFGAMAERRHAAAAVD